MQTQVVVLDKGGRQASIDSKLAMVQFVCLFPVKIAHCTVGCLPVCVESPGTAGFSVAQLTETWSESLARSLLQGQE
jgi:hypothetical protein